MKNKFTRSLNALKKIATRYDGESAFLKTGLLRAISNLSLPSGPQLLLYHDILLFFCTYPQDDQLLRLSEKELRRIAAHIKKSSPAKKSLNENQGLPYADTLTRFSPDLLTWLVLQKDITAVFDSMPEPGLPINDVLNLTLPTLFKENTTAGFDFEGLMESLHIKPREYVSFLLGQLEPLDPLVRDIIMEYMDMFVRIVPKNLEYSRAFNRLPVLSVCFHQELMRKFDYLELINSPVGDPLVLSKSDSEHLNRVIKYAMPLTQREIDTSTYLDEKMVRLFQLERGVMVAIHAMIPQRHLPMESSVGFTLFKNGIPVSYGGTWIFGPRARFGLNIFDTFRGGESAYTLCQLLRVFRHVFRISFFEVESYMFGYDNPDGIKSGAFWFYYRFGFRPMNKSIARLAEKEHQKITANKNYRSSEKTLIHFTQCNMALNLGDQVSMDVTEITGRVKQQLKKAWPHNYEKARQEAVTRFCKIADMDKTGLNTLELLVLEEVALWAMAMNIEDNRRVRLLKQMIFTKPKDLFAYQELLLDYFRQEKATG